MMNVRNTALTVGAVAALGVAPFVAGWEGMRFAAYYDPVGIPTICYGHTRGVEMDDTATEQYCNDLLNTELAEYLYAVDMYINLPMPDTRRAALTSFAYNVGIGNFKRSTLRRLMNEGHTVDACNELKRWVWAKGIRLRGLVRRREAERQLCLKGTTVNV